MNDDLNNAKKLMGALVRMPPKPHSELKERLQRRKKEIAEKIGRQSLDYLNELNEAREEIAQTKKPKK